MLESKATPPLRADARRNRDALLAAAREVFAAEGLDAPLEAIASQAGVGRATLYRRFPTRDDLIGAIFDDDFDELAAIANAAADPAQAYFDVLETALKMQLRNRGFIELFTRRPPSPEVVERVNERFHALVDPPLRAARAAGLVRADLEVEDTAAAILMIGAATANLRGRADADARRARAITLILDGLDPARAPRALTSAA